MSNIDKLYAINALPNTSRHYPKRKKKTIDNSVSLRLLNATDTNKRKQHTNRKRVRPCAVRANSIWRMNACRPNVGVCSVFTQSLCESAIARRSRV